MTRHAASILGTVCVAVIAAAAPAVAGTSFHLDSGQQRAGAPSRHPASPRVRPAHKIATAPSMSLGPAESGGGGPIDFWRLQLAGGQKVRFAVTYPKGNGYEFELYPPRTTDASFPNAHPVAAAQTNPEVGTADLTLRAPRAGSFVFVVCENTSPCTIVDEGGGTNPMNPYTFTPTLLTGKRTGH